MLLLETFHFCHCKFRGCDLGFRANCQCFTFGLCWAALSCRSVKVFLNRTAVFEVSLIDFWQDNRVRERWFIVVAVSFFFDQHRLLASQSLSCLVFNFVFNDTLGGSSDDGRLITDQILSHWAIWIFRHRINSILVSLVWIGVFSLLLLFIIALTMCWKGTIIKTFAIWLLDFSLRLSEAYPRVTFLRRSRSWGRIHLHIWPEKVRVLLLFLRRRLLLLVVGWPRSLMLSCKLAIAWEGVLLASLTIVELLLVFYTQDHLLAGGEKLLLAFQIVSTKLRVDLLLAQIMFVVITFILDRFADGFFLF
mgnify:CR=1 FL=1